MVGGVYLILQYQQNDGQAINVAGEQRMLTKQILIETNRIAEGDISRRDDLTAVAARYDRRLTDLQTGNVARGIPAPPPDVRDQLEVVEAEWTPYYAHIQTLAEEPRDSAEFESALTYIRSRNDALLTETDRTVAIYEQALARKLHRLEQFLGIALILDVVVIIGVVMFFNRNVIRPFSRLTDEARSIATGKLDRSITVRESDDEIGQLTQSIQEMKTQLAGSLREVEEYQQAVHHAGLPIFFTDDDGRIQYVNPAFESLTGYSFAEAVGETPRILKSGEHDDSFYTDLWETVLSGEIWEGEVIDQRKSGQLFTATQTIAPLFDEDDEIIGFVSILKDITERQRKYRYLTALERVIRHNLRNEVNVIQGTAKNLVREWSEPDTTSKIKPIIKSAESLISLSEKAQDIRQMLDQPESEVSLEELQASIRTFCHQHPADADISFVLETAAPKPIDGRLEPAIIELCENAIRHSDQSQPEVTISATATSAREGWIDLAVADTGPGISEQDCDVLESGEETPLRHGSGLGLWLVHMAVTRVGGTIDVSDNQPKGTIVTLSVPILDQTQPSPVLDETQTNDVKN